ncbi:NAD-dependent epimerase/dehydratase family protein [Paenibacillus sp. CMAA1364]
MKKRTILITGASGFTGRHACRYFSEADYHVVAVVRNKDMVKFHSSIEVKICDLTNPNDVQSLIAEVHPDEVLHLAGKVSVAESWEQPMLYMQTNVLATLYLLDAMRLFPKSRILIIGSRLQFEGSSTPQPPHPYSLSKTMQMLATQSWMSLFKQSIVLAEPSNLIGPGPSAGICSLFAKYIVNVEKGLVEPKFRLSSISETRDFLDVRDAVRAYATILTSGVPGTVYPVCSGVERSLGSITEQLMSMTDTPIHLEYGNDIKPSTVTSSSHALQQLGWTVTQDFIQSMQDIIHYYRYEGVESHDI